LPWKLEKPVKMLSELHIKKDILLANSNIGNLF
jgi:hypothetical protein